MTKSRETADLNNGLDVDASGNVGIGTASPSYPLHVSGNAAVTGQTFMGSSLSAATPDYSFLSDSSMGMFRLPGVLGFSTGGTERMCINSSGNVGIGTAAPATMLHLLGDSASKTVGLFLQDSNGSGRNYLMNSTAGRLTFRDSTAAVDRMVIDSSGNVLVGTTVANGLFVVAGNGGGYTAYLNGGTGGQNIAVRGSGTTGTCFRVLNGGGSDVGSIDYTASSTSYGTTSDYRLKENVTPIQGAADIVKAMQPVTYTYKSDGSWMDGFLAHELQELHPRAVTGSKDAVDEEGNPEYQGVDYSKLTPILTAALQEALNKIDALETQNAAFEARLTALEAV